MSLQPPSAAAESSIQRPPVTPVNDATPVLLTRPTRADAPNPSLFGDDVWDLSAAVFEAHVQPQLLDWVTYPEPLRPSFKQYFWAIINLDAHRLEANHTAWSIATIKHQHRFLRSFAQQMAHLGRGDLSQLQASDLDSWVAYVQASGSPMRERHKLLNAVRSMWDYRALLPEYARLQNLIPWDGRRTAELLGALPSYVGENKTPRIDELTMAGLLSWSIAIVEHLAAPITIASRRLRELRQHGPRATQRRFADASEHSDPAQVADIVLAYFRTRNLPLPGYRTQRGVRLHANNIARLVGIPRLSAAQARLLSVSGYPIAEHTVLHEPVAPSIAGRPFQVTFTLTETPDLERVLWSAALVIVSYLSGMRPGEVLNLTRGSARKDGRLHYLVGRTFKDVRDSNGAKDPAGRVRDVPWVVCEPVLRAVAAMENLHENTLLFAARSEWHPEGQARTASPAARTAIIMGLVNWVNTACAAQQRPDPIPHDPNCRSLYMSRFRRTLAWHIARRPQGIVAASIQYGHVGTQMTQGYAGSLASGFPDEHSFEAFLQRLETLGQANTRLQSGEHVSGPAAATYRSRVTNIARFEGITIPSNAGARRLLNSRELQVIQGDALSCVYDPAKALCSKRAQPDASDDAPDLGTCQPSCANIARTDTDIQELRRRAQHLSIIISDPASPPIRHARERNELDRLNSLIDHHENRRIT